MSRSRTAAATLVAASAILVGACGGGPARGAAGAPPPTAASSASVPATVSGAPATTAAAPSTTASPPSTTAPAPSTTSTTLLAPGLAAALPPSSAGSEPQTTVEPSATSLTFDAQMALLWEAVQRDDPSIAGPAFFPLAAYVQVKALSDDVADWHDRLWAHFALDVDAAHRLLGPDPSSAHLVTVQVPEADAGWIEPGVCYNAGAYWHVPGSRVVYEQGGVEKSFGIASLISWRGVWYVVHFGAVEEPDGIGVVDTPTTGPGTPGPPGGC